MWIEPDYKIICDGLTKRICATHHVMSTLFMLRESLGNCQAIKAAFAEDVLSYPNFLNGMKLR